MTDQYLSRYTRATKWKRLLFLAGRELQASELNEFQELILDELHQLGRTIWSSGQVIRGVELSTTGDTATLSSGQIFFDGFFHDFDGGSVPIEASGLEVIGIEFTPRIITESNDPSLYDQTSGLEGSGHAGAHRRVYDLEVRRNSDVAVPLYAIRDGEFSADFRPQPPASDTAKAIARRIYDESGDYLVNGLRVSVASNSNTQFWAVLSAGKAYIQGYEFSFPSISRIAVDKATDFLSVEDEPHTFNTGTSNYTLSNGPVREIYGVSATVQVSAQIEKGAANGLDYLNYEGVSSIVSVVKGATTYVENTDYVLGTGQNGNKIDWSPGGAEPTTGQTYTVTLRYQKQMVIGTDFVREGNQVSFSPNGQDPVDGTAFLVDYSYYVNRFDLIVLTPRGEALVVRGNPGLYPSIPDVPPNTLPIASLKISAQDLPGDVDVKHYDRYRLTMQELSDLRKRVLDLEYNIAVDDLEQEAINVDLPTSKIGIFTDPFRDESKMDTGYVLDGTKPVDCALGVLNENIGTLYPAYDQELHNVSLAARWTMRDWTNAVLTIQRYATHDINVNPYAAVNAPGALTLTPAADIWITDVTIKVQNVTWVESPFPPSVVFNPTITTELISEVAAVSVERTVTAHGEGYAPFLDNLALTYDGHVLAGGLTPIEGTIAGTDTGTLKSDQNGKFAATFVVPAGQVNGSYQVQISNDECKGSTQYLIDGRVRTWLQTTNIVRQLPPADTNDPVAQTFRVEQDCFLSGVDLFFSAKDEVTPLVVSIRNTVNGYPGQQILAEISVLPSAVITSADSTGVTQVRFPSPAFARAGEEYAIVITTLSQNYRIYYATLGGADLATGDPVLTNPATGVFFTSANASAWTADQRSDLKFTLYRCAFGSAEKVVPLNSGNALTVDGSMLCLIATSISPANTEIRWEIERNGDGQWLRIPANVDIDLATMLESVKVKATLAGDDYLSPALFGSIGLSISKWKAESIYASRTMTFPAFNSIDIYLDEARAAGADPSAITYSIDGGESWDYITGSAVKEVNADYTEYHYPITGATSHELLVPHWANATSLKIGMVITVSPDQLKAPRFRRLRAIAR